MENVHTKTVNVKEKFVRLQKESRKVGLRISEDQTKYMCVSRTTGKESKNVSVAEFNLDLI